MQKVVLGMALEVAQLYSFRVCSHDASAGQQGAVNPRLGFADVVPGPTLQASALLVVVKGTRKPGSTPSIAFEVSLAQYCLAQSLKGLVQSLKGIMFLA